MLGSRTDERFFGVDSSGGILEEAEILRFISTGERARKSRSMVAATRIGEGYGGVRNSSYRSSVKGSRGLLLKGMQGAFVATHVSRLNDLEKTIESCTEIRISLSWRRRAFRTVLIAVIHPIDTGQADEWQRAVSLVEAMRSRGYLPAVVVLATVIAA